MNYSNPEALAEPLGAYSHVASASGIVSIAGQVGADRSGIVADGTANQVVLAFDNVRLALEAEGLQPSDLLQLTTYLITPDDIPVFYEARAKVFASMFPDGGYPPNTLLVVSRLVQPELLVEMAALAVRQ
jgi:enamine deaminase RidA (YjgF/YER057c/UK114 family)